MKLLFDQNLSPRLAMSLSNLFPGSQHVYRLQLDRVPDVEVWKYAKVHDFVVVSKDADFSELSLLRGHPPKLIWLRLGNCTTEQIEELLHANRDSIEQMNRDPSVAVLSLI